MAISGISMKKCFSQKFLCCIIMVINVLLIGSACMAGDRSDVHHYKMVSSVEYTGKGQFRNQVETLFTVRKQSLSGNEVQYSLSLYDHDPNLAISSSSTTLSFIVDRATHYLSGYSEDMALWAKVNNESVKSLTKVTKDNIGKTWKQSIDLSSLDTSLPPKLMFTLTAIEVTTDRFGEMVAVRAMSEPFFIKVGKSSPRCKINAVYLFDPEIEEIYLSISVFEAHTDFNGFGETLHHEVATYKTDAAGMSVDLTGLGTEFEKFAREVGLRTKGVKVVNETPLPSWAQSEGLTAAQVANICVAMACEGAPNPVVTVCIPAARLVAMQSMGQISTVGAFASTGTVANTLGQSVPGIASAKIAMAPAFAGWGLGTTATVAGAATAGGLVIDNNTGNDSSTRSPVTP